MILFIAQGFGVGTRLPAPGTWGSLLGLGLFVLLVGPGNYFVYLGATVLSILVSVPICTLAERALGRKDPGSVVLDELTAMPLCYLGWVTHAWLAIGNCSWGTMFAQPGAGLTFGLGFLVFRFFDILKPWPIGAIQQLPRGWGVVLDDVLAAFCTATVLLIVIRII